MATDDELVLLDANELKENRAYDQAKSELPQAIYKMWVDSEDEDEREKLHSLAFSAKMLFRILDTWAVEGGKLTSVTRQEWESQQREAVN